MSMNRCMTLSHDLELEIAIVKLHGLPQTKFVRRKIRPFGNSWKSFWSKSNGVFLNKPESKIYVNDSDRID